MPIRRRVPREERPMFDWIWSLFAGVTENGGAGLTLDG